jgi:hypothetical protein
MHMWHHVTNHLIISNDKDSNSENRIKLRVRDNGPFIIKRVLSPITYQLTLPHQWKIHDVFHVDLLTPYIETDFHGPNYTRPPPDLIDGEEEYEVESVLKSRRYGRGRKVQYLVKWKGYTNSDNEWVNWDDMHADEALVEFKRQQPQAITHIRRAANETESTTHQMSTDAFCAALPYAELEGPIPYDGPSIAATYNDPDASATVGSGYSPAETRRHAAWVRAWKELNCQVPSSWKTPSPTPPQSPTPPEYLDVRCTYKVQQNLIDPMYILRSTLARSGRGPSTIPIRSRTPSPHPSDTSSEALSPQPFYITNTVPATATDPLTIPIVTFFFLITVHVTDYHWDRHLYFVIHPHHAQTMTHTPPSDDSILVHLLVVLVACDSD